MKIFPAIDLLGGKVVRLQKGDYARVTEYALDPRAVAKTYAEAGAEWLHIVDLDGAKSGSTPNFSTIERVAREGDLRVQTGGGIRSIEAARRCFDAGVSRVIVGTAAVEDPKLLEKLLEKFGEKVAVGVDILDGRVAIKGWVERSAIDAFDFCARLESLGVRTVICTDISKDGLLAGTNVELYKRLAERFSLDLVASGGVSGYADIEALKGLGLYGAIVGRALYEGGVDLKTAIELAKTEGEKC